MQTILVAQNVINAVQASISIHGDKDQERHGYLIRKLLVKVRSLIDFLMLKESGSNDTFYIL